MKNLVTFEENCGLTRVRRDTLVEVLNELPISIVDVEARDLYRLSNNPRIGEDVYPDILVRPGKRMWVGAFPKLLRDLLLYPLGVGRLGAAIENQPDTNKEGVEFRVSGNVISYKMSTRKLTKGGYNKRSSVKYSFLIEGPPLGNL
jgi:hypothetical protein